MSSNNNGTQPSKNCRPRCHIMHEYFGVYDFAVSLSVNNGECRLSQRTVARWCNMSRWTAKRGLEWLVDKDWLKDAEPRKQRVERKFIPVIHDDWVARHGSGKCVRHVEGRKRRTKAEMIAAREEEHKALVARLAARKAQAASQSLSDRERSDQKKEHGDASVRLETPASV